MFSFRVFAAWPGGRERFYFIVRNRRDWALFVLIGGQIVRMRTKGVDLSSYIEH